MTKGIMYDHSKKREIKKEDVDWVDMDFDTCVKEQRRECYYGQDSDAIKDQRTQMGQFCGHDEVQLFFLNNKKIGSKKIIFTFPDLLQIQ